MKKLYFVMFIVLLISGCAVFNKSRSAEEEVLIGSAMGYRGLIYVQVHMNSGRITDIKIADSIEDRFVGEAAIHDLIEMAINYNSTDIDVISGATVTSKGFLEAVHSAIMSK